MLWDYHFQTEVVLTGGPYFKQLSFRASELPTTPKLAFDFFEYLLGSDAGEAAVSVAPAHPPFVDTVRVCVALPLTFSLFAVLVWKNT